MQEAQSVERLKRLVEEHGRVKAAQLLGVNFRTLAASIKSGKLSHRIRGAMREYEEALEQATETDHSPSGPAGDEIDEKEESATRLDALEEEVGSLRALVGEQSEEMQELTARVERLEQAHDEGGESGQDTEPTDVSMAGEPDGPNRPHASPDVVTLEPQEAENFGSAAALVEEWRMLRTRDDGGKSKVEQARAEERRWELEIEMIEQFGLTLPPETEPLTPSDMETHLGWRRETLKRVRKERAKAETLDLLRRIATLGLWWR